MLTKEQIASLFKGWKKLYRSKMKDEDWDMDTVKVWLIVLNDMNTTDQEFNLAKRVSIRYEWPPTHPVDFLKLGRTETASNYPDMRTEYLAAAQGNYKHEVTLETAKRVGSWELKTQPESVSYKSWQKHYVEVCEEHSQGSDFKVPETHRVEHSHAPVQAGSEADKRISEKLAELRRMAV
ncbi:hypothetical protein [Psychrobacter immobilis]|uniref:hypothetical protein n=1 Tax=Psychrobacter immobilis TaxID=498 RepID=UPI003FD26EC8